MTDVTDTEEKIPPHHWTDKETNVTYRWGGLSTCFCVNCKQCFTTVDAFDRHYISGDEEMTCFPPDEIKTRTEQPAFEWEVKPTWTTGGVWRRYRPNLREHPAVTARR